MVQNLIVHSMAHEAERAVLPRQVERALRVAEAETVAAPRIGIARSSLHRLRRATDRTRWPLRRPAAATAERGAAAVAPRSAG